MVSKEEAKIKLRKAGYTVAADNAVITILVSEGTNIKNVVKNIKELFLEIGYEASFGVRQTNSDMGDVSVNDEEDAFDAITEDVSEDTADVAALADIKEKPFTEDIIVENKAEKKAKKPVAKSKAKVAKSKIVEEDDFFDDEDENPEEAVGNIELDAFDMDMLLNEDSVQFSLEDFGMM